MTTINNPSKEKTVFVPLSQLHSLDSAAFRSQLPEHSTRKTSTEQVSNLRNAVTIEQKGDDKVVTTFPPLSVANIEETIYILDGYHRQEAIEQYLRLVVLGLTDNDTLTVLALSRALKQPLDETLQKQLDELRTSVKVPVTIGVYKDLKAIAIFTLKVNFTHGLRPEGKAKSLMAVEYYNLTRDTDNPPSQAEVARIFGIGRNTLNEYLREKGLGVDTVKPEGSTDDSGDTGKEPDEKQEETAEEKFCAKLASALKLLDKVDDLLPYIQQMKQSLTAKQISVLVELASEKGGKHTPTAQTDKTPKQQVKGVKGTRTAKKDPVTLDPKDSQLPVNEESIA
jgi:hypothetical protein